MGVLLPLRILDILMWTVCGTLSKFQQVLAISRSCYNSYLNMLIKIGIDRIKALLEHINYARSTVHIVGMNGKGSILTLIEHVLLSSGLSIGKFTSPVYDCISVNGQAVSSLTYE